MMHSPRRRLVPYTAALCRRTFTSSSSVFDPSPIPTMHFQQSLPRLPVPTLENTVSRFTEAVQPILSSSEFEDFSGVLQDFAKSDGPQLHKQLLDFAKDNSHTSYITDFWFDMYLRDRRRIPFTHTPFISATMPPYDLGTQNPQSKRATNVIISALKFKQALDNNTLKPDIFFLDPKTEKSALFQNLCRMSPRAISYYTAYMFKAYPLDMSQYANLFSSTRLPKPEKDELSVNPNAKNVIFLRNGHIYSVDVLDAAGNIIDAQELMQNIEWILCDTSAPAFPPGVLTTMDRDSWSDMRAKLVDHSDSNEKTLRLVDGSLFVVSLENETFDEENMSKKETEKLLKHLLVGDGKNRWFDKCLNLMVQRDGSLTVQFEHAWGDGVSVVRFLNDVVSDSNAQPAVTHDMAPAVARNHSQMTAAITRAKLGFPPDLQARHSDALIDFQKKVASLEMSIHRSTGFGQKQIKAAKLSPDSIMQLAIQLAYFRISDGATVPSYESCSTCAFKHGRTETVRPATNQTRAFTEAFYTNSEKSTLQELLKKCSKKHGQLTKNAATGQGCDRHLYALKQLASANEAKNGKAIPKLFRHELYEKVHNFTISTSTVPSPYCAAGGFCPVVPDGLGVGYDIKDDMVGFAVTSYNSRKCQDFTDCMPEIFDRLQKIIS